MLIGSANAWRDVTWDNCSQYPLKQQSLRNESVKGSETWHCHDNDDDADIEACTVPDSAGGHEGGGGERGVG